MFLALLNNAILALVYTLDKELLKFLPPMLFLALRTIICGGFFGILFFVLNRNYKIRFKKFIIFSFISFIYVYLTNYFLYKAFTVLTSAKATLIYNFNPFIVALFSFFIFKEKFSMKKVIGLAIGWCGFIPLLLFNNSESSSFVISGGELFAMLSAVCAAGSFILLQKELHNQKIPPSYTSAITLFVGGVCALVNSYFTEMPFSERIYSNIFSLYVISLFIIIVLATIFWSYINCYLSKWYKASFLSFVGFTVPLFAAVFERFLFSRSVGWNFYLSLIFIAIGLYLFYKSEYDTNVSCQTN